MTIEETNLLLEEMKRTSSYLIVVLAFRTGMRIGEVLGVTPDCIDWKKKKIHVKQTLCVVKGRFEFHPPKSDSGERYIPMTTDVEELLKKQIEMKQEVMMSGKMARPGFEYFNQKYPDINFEPVHPHTLRHTFATRALKNGVSMKALQKLLGHSNIRITSDLYCHVLEGVLDDEMGKLEHLAVTV